MSKKKKEKKPTTGGGGKRGEKKHDGRKLTGTILGRKRYGDWGKGLRERKLAFLGRNI